MTPKQPNLKTGSERLRYRIQQLDRDHRKQLAVVKKMAADFIELRLTQMGPHKPLESTEVSDNGIIYNEPMSYTPGAR